MSELHRRSPHVPLVVLAIVGLTGLVGCSSLNGASTRIAGVISPYKLGIVQGNVVTREQMALVKPGVQRAQVRDILGTALLTSVFHADRWDYVFTLNQQGVAPRARRVTVFFKDGVVDRTEADPLPTEAEFVATLKSPFLPGSVPNLEATEESLKKFPPPSKPVVTTTATASPTDYPPLEAIRP